MRGPVVVPSAGSRGAVRDIAAWPTSVPGLAVAEMPRQHKCGGLAWCVIHARSGKRAPYCLPDPESALAFAQMTHDNGVIA